MGRVLVHGGSVVDGRIQSLQVKLGALPRRTIDRDTAVAWMKDMHSFLPVVGGAPGPALLLVEGDDGEAYIRADASPESADALPAGLPTAG